MEPETNNFTEFDILKMSMRFKHSNCLNLETYLVFVSVVLFAYYAIGLSQTRNETINDIENTEIRGSRN